MGTNGVSYEIVRCSAESRDSNARCLSAMLIRPYARIELE